MSIILDAPPEVRQTTPNSCWAAAFNSWSRAVGANSPPTEDRLRGIFAGVRNALDGEGGASESGISTLAHLGFMAARRVRGVSLTPNFFETTLRQFGHIYLAYRPAADGGTSGHVVVAYGVNDANQLLVMNPDPEVLFPCRTPIDWFTRRTSAVVCTSLLGRRHQVNPFAP